MRKINAYQTADGTLCETHADAKRHAQRQYDDHMTRLRHDLVSSSNGHMGMSASMVAMTWIEENFGKIATAYRLKRDLDSVDDMTESDD